MSYLDSLEQCVGTLTHCNDNLNNATKSLSSLTRTFPRVETVIRCEKKYDLTTATDINKAQTLISKEAVPFLFRQVDQLENAIEAIRAAHESLGQKVEDQKAEYSQLIDDEASMVELQNNLKAEQSALSDAQANLLNAKSLLATKERDLAELTRARSAVRQKSAILDEATRHEMSGIPTDDLIQDSSDGADKYVVLDCLREQLSCFTDAVVDEKMDACIENAMGTIELLENKVFVPWWDSNTSLQTERLGYLSRLLRYFFKDHGTTMQTIIEILLDHQAMTVEDLRRELSTTGQATTELPLLINHLKTIGAVTTETTTRAGGHDDQVMEEDTVAATAAE
ncbi:hypothetical protein BX661DRAFT_183980 [Kickxella alabastrina]|uniref:uncharacterized protein n=1 Tax=Kickxella alabastrina TaxID=61397 RepID=UPI00222111A8|nr:uncharacterized protein BX661DRAFT_183980 [Kickxella alabastrina]KAI7826408.1 hypothetical protein BX661DRAFT_183980 [Kickxella alabastrina]